MILTRDTGNHMGIAPTAGFCGHDKERPSEDVLDSCFRRNDRVMGGRFRFVLSAMQVVSFSARLASGFLPPLE